MFWTILSLLPEGGAVDMLEPDPDPEPEGAPLARTELEAVDPVNAKHKLINFDSKRKYFVLT